MATTTPNYGWPVPTDTDYVKDGAAAIEALGDAIDATVYALPSGGMTLISTTTFSGSTLTLSAIPQTYKNLYLVVRNWLPSGDNEGYHFRMNSDATASRHFSTSVLGGANNVFNSTLWTNFQGFDNAVSQHTAVINLYDYTNTTTWKMGNWIQFGNNETTPTNFDYMVGWGIYNQTAAVTSVQIVATGGTFTSGTVLLYGVG